MKAKVTNKELDAIINEALDERDNGVLITEATTGVDEDKVKSIVKKEIKKIINAETTTQFEQMVAKMVKDKIKGDKDVEDHLVKINRNVLVQLYKTLWMKRNFWADSLSNHAN